MQRTGATQSAYAILAVLAAVAIGCGGSVDGKLDDGSVADRPIDSILDPPIDAPPIDAPSPIDATVDAAGCGQAVLLQGYYLDWDSTLANPIGIGGSRWTVVGDPTRMTEAQPSGLVSMCIAPAGISRISVTGPQGYLGATFVADPAVFSVPNTRFIVRGVQAAGPMGAAAQFAEFGVAYSSGRAHVLVYNVGAPIPLALAPEPNPPQGTYISGGNFNDITWSAGDTGKLTLFPNRPFGTGTATLTSTSAFTGPTEIPLVQNAFTIVVIRTAN